MSAVEQADLVVCVSSHMAGPNAVVINEGQVKRANDPLVLAAPSMYMAKGTPREQWPTPFDGAVERSDTVARDAEQAKREAFEAAARANAVKIEEPKPVEFRTAKRDVLCTLDGAPTTVRKGSKLPADHPVVLEHPDAF